jgi:Mg-chelatase subunit ChlD
VKRSLMSSLLVFACVAGVATTALVGSQGCSAATKANGFGQTDAGEIADTGIAVDPDVLQIDLSDAKKTEPTDAPVCATAAGKKQLVPLVLQFVVDGSGSMSGAPWTAQVNALKAVFQSYAASKDPNLAVGMIVFADSKQLSPINQYPGANDVFPQVFTANSSAAVLRQLEERLSGNSSGGTPTFEALTGGYSLLEGFQPLGAFPALFKRVVVLLTDGAPSGPIAQVVALVKTKANASSIPIQTFSIGVGSVPPQFMSDIAIEGQTAPPGCVTTSSNASNSCYFPIPTSGNVAQIQSDFIDAITAIRGRASACEYLIELTDENSTQYDPKQVNVTFVDGNGKSTTLVKDPQNGWSYDDDNDPKKVLLHGTSCDKVKVDKKGDVNIALGCPTRTN